MDIDLVAAFPDAADGDVAGYSSHKVAGFVVDEDLESLIVGANGGPPFGDGGFGDLVVIDHNGPAFVPFEALARGVSDKVSGTKEAVEQKAVVVVSEDAGGSIVGATKHFFKLSIILEEWKGVDAVVDNGLEGRAVVRHKKVEGYGHCEGGFFVKCWKEFGGDVVDLFEPILGGESIKKVADLFDGDIGILDHRVKRHSETSGYRSLGSSVAGGLSGLGRLDGLPNSREIERFEAHAASAQKLGIGGGNGGER